MLASGGLVPGGGAMVAAVELAAETTALCVGKPSQTLANHIVTTYGIDCSRAVMVGDRLDTDILFGNTAGMKTLLVLSGVTQQPTADLLVRGAAKPGTPIPTYIAPSIATLLR
jgi:ribonucleotide monophosphatase NagD (HAD superfamily)